MKLKKLKNLCVTAAIVVFPALTKAQDLHDTPPMSFNTLFNMMTNKTIQAYVDSLEKTGFTILNTYTASDDKKYPANKDCWVIWSERHDASVGKISLTDRFICDKGAVPCFEDLQDRTLEIGDSTRFQYRREKMYDAAGGFAVDRYYTNPQRMNQSVVCLEDISAELLNIVNDPVRATRFLPLARKTASFVSKSMDQ